MITEPRAQNPARPAGDREPLTRRIALPAAAVGAAGIATAGLLGMLLPHIDPFGTGMPGMLGFVGEHASTVETAIGILALLVVGLHRAMPRALAQVAAGLLGLAAAISLPGSAIAGAGYLLALIVVVALPVLLIALSLRHPAVGVPLLALLVGGLAAGELTGAFPVSAFLGVFAGGIAGVWLTLLATASHTLAGLALLALAVPVPGTRVADAVRRARVPVTVVAALCALPYVVARASWLTPWPLLGPGREVLDAQPGTIVTGLLLGTAMLVGGVLTLGLILRWGERFPRWVPGVGGRPVPVPLAVVPALLVAVLFAVGGPGLAGLGSAAQQVGAPAIEAVTMLLVFPFWLWGPLLAVAAWGYALHRRETARPRP
ncbi:hypothetical protein SAMN04487783_1505 [Agrococcus baldri]|uniref:Uncharacterized protein n=1 Tax=Agrococcus baldri TaxID=153730 RepID=A0AA94HMM2_9MICO|nr:hypothetical protein [Agrococcus baldri]SFS11046.1 hypothetical protein SAMN04487783_1505 [Agrococcus baldri]